MFSFVGLSFLVHLQVVLVVIAVLYANPEGCQVDPLELAPFEVTLVPAEPEPRPIPPEEIERQEKEREKEELDLKGQVVDLPPPEEERRPDKARFLSEYDSRTRKETKGPAVPFKPGKLVANRPVRSRKRAAPSQRRKVERKVMKLAMRRRPELPRAADKPDEKGDEPARQPDAKPRKPEDKSKVKRAKGQGKKRVTLKDLKLSPAELAKALGTRANDALRDVKSGKRTLLNSKRWRFASFFNRVKRQVAQNWHPNRVYRRRDPSGNVYGFRDRLTILRVKLSPKGRLKGVHLEKASGVGFLDDEAISAFKLAQPFPNPPKGLVDKQTGTISFRFGFLFEISRRPSFRIFRYR